MKVREGYEEGPEEEEEEEEEDKEEDKEVRHRRRMRREDPPYAPSSIPRRHECRPPLAPKHVFVVSGVVPWGS